MAIGRLFAALPTNYRLGETREGGGGRRILLTAGADINFMRRRDDIAGLRLLLTAPAREEEIECWGGGGRRLIYRYINYSYHVEPGLACIPARCSCSCNASAVGRFETASAIFRHRRGPLPPCSSCTFHLCGIYNFVGRLQRANLSLALFVFLSAGIASRSASGHSPARCDI